MWQPRVCLMTCGGLSHIIPPRHGGGLELLLLAHFHVRWLSLLVSCMGSQDFTLNITKMNTRFTWAPRLSCDLLIEPLVRAPNVT